MQYDGAKHLVGQLGVEHTAMIARYFPSVIWMIRRNRLRAVVSALIAEQTLVWHLREESQELSDKLQPISLDRVAEFLANQERNIENAEQIIESEQLPVIRLVYEDLFDPEKSLHSRVEEIYKLVGNFVDVETDPKFRFKIAERLDQATNKVSTSNTYRRIPNIQEIEGAFGCEKNGSLF
ncbi:MAG: Stf0 family sulfotransferase [Planctomycetota bacterium]